MPDDKTDPGALPAGVFLPSLLREVADKFGIDPALRLAEAFGGQQVKLPRRARIDHTLARRVGLGVHAWLVEHYGGERITIPMGPRHPDKVRAAHRLAEVARLTAQGISTAEIARRLVIHERHVRDLRARAADDGRQMKLDLVPARVAEPGPGQSGGGGAASGPSAPRRPGRSAA